MFKFKKLINVIKQLLQDNVLLVGLVLSGVLNDFILRCVTVGSIFKIKPILVGIAILIIIVLIATLFINKRRNYLYLVFSGFFTFLSIANYMYYTHFKSFISIGIVNQSSHLKEMSSSIINTFDIKILLFLIPLIIFILFYKKLERNGYFHKQTIEISKRKEVRNPFFAALAILLLIAPTITGPDISRLVKQWNREYLVENFGIYTFSMVDMIKTVTIPRSVSADYGDFDKDIMALVKANQKKLIENKYTDILENRDIYVIHYESVQTFAMDLTFNNGPVTPFLNQLTKDGLFFDNFYPQHSVGTSSDSEFTFNTSLYPINNGTVFIDHYEKEFESLQKLLVNKGYHTMSMHGNNANFWNRSLMHPNLGYQEVLGKDDYIIDEEIGLGLSDMSFFRQSVNKLKNRKAALKKPIMAKLITLTNHHPFDVLPDYQQFDTGYLEGSEISKYLKSMRYADDALKYFFQEMEAANLLDNAAIIIYGDHHASISEADYEMLYNYQGESDTVLDNSDKNFIKIDNAFLQQVQKTPLLIWTKDKVAVETVSEPIGMIDVFPTLANMLNIDNDYQLGNDIFNVSDNSVIFPEGSFLTKDFFYSAANSQVYNLKTNEVIMSKREMTEQMLEKIADVEYRLTLSSNIIQNNLIQYYNNLKK